MRSLKYIALIASAIALTGAATPSRDSRIGIKIAPENDHVDVLPLTADEAARRFGVLSPAQSKIVSSTCQRLFDKLRASTDNQWDGPELFLSHSIERDYRPSNVAELRKVLAGQTVSVFDPMKLGAPRNETDAVVVVKIDSGANPQQWTAIAFVLNGDVVQRIVGAPPPWITLGA